MPRRTARRTRCRARSCAARKRARAASTVAALPLSPHPLDAARLTPSPRARGEGWGEGSRADASLDVAGIDDRVDVGSRFDDAELEQQIGRLLAELRVLAGEEFLVRRLVLPAQVLRR